MLIRGTKRLLTELGVTVIHPVGDGSPQNAFGEWYGNLIRIDRRKCMVFADASTLFTFMIPGVLRKQYKDFRTLFLSHLRSALATEDLPLPDLEFANRIVFGPTRDRRVLSSLNELVFLLTVYIDAAGGLAHTDLGRVIRKVNDTPMTLIDDSPGRAMRHQIGAGRYDSSGT